MLDALMTTCLLWFPSKFEMKKINLTNKRSYKMKTLVTLVVVLLLSFGLNAKDARKNSRLSFNSVQIENLKLGVHSDNDGLKRNCVYLAGKYQIEDLGKDLLDELSSEKSPSNRILIALSLSYIGYEKGIEYIKEMSLTDEDSKVRQICSSIYEKYLNNLKDYYEDTDIDQSALN